MLRRNRTKVRWLFIRLFIDNLKNLFRGWLFRMTTRKVDAEKDFVDWTILSESIIQVKRWEGMNEINASRFHNMHTACTLVDGVLLKPRHVFSLRRFFKEVSSNQGFQAGPVIVNGKITYADGGGVCAAASLIFDAALKANLAILEKHNHSTDMWGDQRFIHLGGDATYVYGRRDLKLQNNHKADILFNTTFDYESLTLKCRLYSPVPLEGSVRIENQMLQKILPTNLNEQKYYRDGCVIMTRRYFIMTDGNDVMTYSKIEKYLPFRLII